MKPTIKQRLQRALEEERRPRAQPERAAPETTHEAIERFLPVVKAAEELAESVAETPEIRFTISPEEVWIELYDRHLFFGFDAVRHLYVADEIDYSWLDRDVREERASWPEVEDCIDAMVRSCARYVVLARALRMTAPASGGKS